MISLPKYYFRPEAGFREKIQNFFSRAKSPASPKHYFRPEAGFREKSKTFLWAGSPSSPNITSAPGALFATRRTPFPSSGCSAARFRKQPSGTDAPHLPDPFFEFQRRPAGNSRPSGKAGASAAPSGTRTPRSTDPDRYRCTAPLQRRRSRPTIPAIPFRRSSPDTRRPTGCAA